MTEKRFPVLGSDPPQTIPWAVAERAYIHYHKWFITEARNRFRIDPLTFDEWHEKGGLTPAELDEWAPGWREDVK